MMIFKYILPVLGKSDRLKSFCIFWYSLYFVSHTTRLYMPLGYLLINMLLLLLKRDKKTHKRQGARCQDVIVEGGHQPNRIRVQRNFFTEKATKQKNILQQDLPTF